MQISRRGKVYGSCYCMWSAWLTQNTRKMPMPAKREQRCRVEDCELGAGSRRGGRSVLSLASVRGRKGGVERSGRDSCAGGLCGGEWERVMSESRMRDDMVCPLVPRCRARDIALQCRPAPFFTCGGSACM